MMTTTEPRNHHEWTTGSSAIMLNVTSNSSKEPMTVAMMVEIRRADLAVQTRPVDSPTKTLPVKTRCRSGAIMQSVERSCTAEGKMSE